MWLLMGTSGPPQVLHSVKLLLHQGVPENSDKLRKRTQITLHFVTMLVTNLLRVPTVCPWVPLTFEQHILSLTWCHIYVSMKSAHLWICFGVCHAMIVVAQLMWRILSQSWPSKKLHFFLVGKCAMWPLTNSPSIVSFLLLAVSNIETSHRCRFYIYCKKISKTKCK